MQLSSAQTSFYLPGLTTTTPPPTTTTTTPMSNSGLTSQQQQSANSNYLMRRHGPFTKLTVSLKRNQGDVWIRARVSGLLVGPANPRRRPSSPASARVSGRISALQLWGRRNVSSVYALNGWPSWKKWEDVKRKVEKGVRKERMCMNSINSIIILVRLIQNTAAAITLHSVLDLDPPHPAQNLLTCTRNQ